MTVPSWLTTPITEADVSTLIDWTDLQHAPIPADQRPAIVAYEHTVVGIEDCFDGLDGDMIRACSLDAAKGPLGMYPAKEADSYVRAHLVMLDTWHDALDGLDSELRGDTVSGGLPAWAGQYLKAEALSLFAAATALQRAVLEYHHGGAGPRLDPAYGYGYPLSCSVLNPF